MKADGKWFAVHGYNWTIFNDPFSCFIATSLFKWDSTVGMMKSVIGFMLYLSFYVVITGDSSRGLFV